MARIVEAVAGGFSLMLFGVFMAIVLQQLHERGIVIDEFTTGTITISDLMFLVFFCFVLMGIFFILVWRS